MASGSLFEAAGKIAGIGGLSIALIYLAFRGMISTGILKTLPPGDRQRILRFSIGCVFAISLTGVVVYALSIVQGPTSNFTVGHDAKVGGSADLQNSAHIGHDFSVSKDLTVGGQKDTRDGH